MANRGTLKEAAAYTIRKANNKVSKSPKKRKAPERVFGPSSQFRGVGTGVPGDVRK